MIKSFRHRGLKALHRGERPDRIAPEHIAKLKRILTVLDQSGGPEDMNLPGFQLHRLKGSLRGFYAVSVSGNWRVTFGFKDGDVVDVNCLDYH